MLANIKMTNVNIRIILSVLLFLIIYNNGFSQNHLIGNSVNYLRNNELSPEEYILSKFKTKDIILLAEEHRVKENLELVQNIIPDLYKNGIYNIGMEFGASEDQKTLDSLVCAPKYNEQVARKIMFNYNSGWTFKEYMNIYRAAWKLNKSLPKNAKKFRVVNLSYQFNWSSFNDKKTPENMREVFSKGNTESYRYNIVKNEIIYKGGKILILTGHAHAFTKYKNPVFDYLSENFVRFENGYFSNLLYKEFPNQVFSILLHKSFDNYPNHVPKLVSPADGKIEHIMKKLNNKPVGFDLNNTPLGELRDNSYYSMGYINFTLNDFFDGYIFIKPLRNLTNCTIDSAFFDLIKNNWEQAKKTMPDPGWATRPKSADEYWKQIKLYRDITDKYKKVDKL